jgi:hypothetical protein
VFLVQADFSGTAFGAAPTWTDITAYVLTVDDPPIVINWGRQDEQSELQPRTCSMTLDNSDGRFTPGLTTGPYGAAVDVGVRIRVSTTANAVTTVRFDGYVNDWDAGWDNGGPMAVCTVDASDIFAQMGTLQPLRSLVLEEMILDAPSALYPLDEAEGATSAGDLTGKNAAATVQVSKYGPGTLDFGSATTLIDQAGMVAVSSPDSGSATTTARATYLSAPNAMPAAGAFTVTAAFVGPAVAPAASETIAFLPGKNAAGANQVQILVSPAGSGFAEAVVFGNAGFDLTVAGTTNVCDGLPHVVAATLSADNKSLTLTVDGVVQGTAAVGSGIAWANPGTAWSLGALVVPGLLYGGPLTGSLALFGQYAAALSTARLLAHYTAGKTAFAGERTDIHAARLLSYRPNTGTALDVGRGAVGVHDTSGVALQQALQDTGDAEGGPVFADGQGRITLYNRGRLYDPPVGFTLDASLDQVTADLRFRRDTQDIVNDDTVSWPGGASQRAVNATSVNKYGTKAITPTLIINSARDAADAAGWTVAVGKTVRTKSPQLAVDLLTEPSAAQAAAVLAAGPLTVVNITNLPAATSPATSVKAVLQGGVETIGVDGWDIAFHATALPPGTLRADGAPSANTKLDSGLVIAW